MDRILGSRSFARLVAVFLVLVTLLTCCYPALADSEHQFYSKSDFKLDNMINLEIHYIGLIEKKCTGYGVTNKNELKFVGWIPIYDIIGDYAYIPSKLDIYKIKFSKFAFLDAVGSDFNIVAAYRTVYHNSSDNRKFNIQKVSEIINGTVIKSGESFSYNKVTGPRGQKQGYKIAPVIKHGEYVDDYGGGVCQVSSTIYAAIINNPNFRIQKRKPHALIVSYLPEGMDATVSYDSTDFKFRNDYPFDVVVNVSADDGACVVTITRQ